MTALRARPAPQRATGQTGDHVIGLGGWHSDRSGTEGTVGRVMAAVPLGTVTGGIPPLAVRGTLGADPDFGMSLAGRRGGRRVPAVAAPAFAGALEPRVRARGLRRGAIGLCAATRLAMSWTQLRGEVIVDQRS